MKYENNTLLGRITRIHGFDGTVVLLLGKSFIENLPPMESVFLEVEGRPVPFFISAMEYNGGDILKLQFDGYNSPEKVSEFTGCNVWLTSDRTEFIQHDDSSVLPGYTIELKDKRKLGVISEVIPNPGQYLLRVTTPENREILVPLHSDLIIRIDKRNKLITMDLPEGLEELN